ncbi:MAG: ATP-binding cassette domain-containing protein [Collinsella sp.]
MNIIETHALSRVYGKRRAVDSLDMRVAAGEIYGFVGKNGAGKSTAMKMIAGLVRPTSGSSRALRCAATSARGGSPASAHSSKTLASCRRSPHSRTSRV